MNGDYLDYLAHYRTPGSKNGVSHTPGYDAVGKPAMSEAERKAQRKLRRAEKAIGRANWATKKKAQSDARWEKAAERFGNTHRKNPVSMLNPVRMYRLGQMSNQYREGKAAVRMVNRNLNVASKNLKDLDMHIGYDVIAQRYNITPNKH